MKRLKLNYTLLFVPYLALFVFVVISVVNAGGSFLKTELIFSFAFTIPTALLSLVISVVNYWNIQEPRTIKALIITSFVFLVNLILMYPFVQYLIAISKYGIS